MEYASYGEAPSHLYFWVGAATVAGALRRKVWIDQAYFRWFPNLYVIIVAPPGIVSKSTTANIGMKLLKQVPGIQFGPAVITWQALVQAFGSTTEGFEHNGEVHTMSAMTISSSEFGNLLNPHDKDMVDMLVNLWDGESFQKRTKMSGNDEVVNPWLNIIACTTPDWIAGSFPEYMIGGGFTSRCVFVYAEEKEKYVAYPGLSVPPDITSKAQSLVHDLEYISMNLCGEYKLTPAAVKLGEDWYQRHYRIEAKQLDPAAYGGYVARKQTHTHKLAMLLAASQRDELVITDTDLHAAINMVSDLEKEMPKVFDKIGMKNEAVNLERMILYIKTKGNVPVQKLYATFAKSFPSMSELEDVLKLIFNAGYARVDPSTGNIVAIYGNLTEQKKLQAEQPAPSSPD